MKRIATEEHFYLEEFTKYLESINKMEIPRDGKIDEHKRPAYELYPRVISKIFDLGEGRLRMMDEAGIDMSVLSYSNPGVEMIDASTGTTWAKKINDELYKVIKKYPKRFAGLASLAYQSPVAAANELERAVKELGLKGAKINSHINGEYLDDQKYWIIFEKAEKLGVPLYLHPKMPPPDMVKPYLAYPALAGPMHGFGADTSLHAMRLICSGVFDKYPGLKIILGHLGEALPFWLWRVDKLWRDGHRPDPNIHKLVKRPSEYIKNNFYMTTSGMFYQPALLCALLSVGAERILFAVDHPYEESKQAVDFMDAAPISDIDKEKIYHINAEKLLGL